MTDLNPSHARTVVISGAGSGIGQAAAVKFGELGWRVAVGGRRPENLAATAALVEAAGGRCAAHRLDVSDAGSVEEFFTAAEAACGTVTAVVNNAASARYGPLDDFSPADIFAEVGSKLLGSLYMARRGIQAMKRDGQGGDILFVTSPAAVQPYPHHLPYAAASAGVEHAARTLRLELEGTGIRVGVVRCGETMGTEFSARERESGRSGAASGVFFRHGLLRHYALLTPADVAAAIVAAVTLPPSCQYEVLAVSPVAPPGDLPATFGEWGAGMMRRYG